MKQLTDLFNAIKSDTERSLEELQGLGSYLSNGQETLIDRLVEFGRFQDEYARELAKVSAVLSDNFLKEIYGVIGEGYIDAVDAIHEWAMEFMDRFYHLYAEDWEEFCYSDTNPYNGRTDCWDDVVIAFGEEKVNGNRPIHFIRPENAMYSEVQGIVACREIIAGKVVALDVERKGKRISMYFAIRQTRTKGQTLLCSINPAVPNDKIIDKPNAKHKTINPDESDVVMANFDQGFTDPVMMWGMAVKYYLEQSK